MLTTTRKARRAVAALMLMMASVQSPIFAGEVADCYAYVLGECAAALETARWWQKPAVGLLCAGMLAGCVGDGWFN